jgi:transcriptional regulator with XRE-family HTH domain
MEVHETATGGSVTIVEEYRESGLTQREFCEARGIAKSTLGYWLRKGRKATSAESPTLVRISAPAIAAGFGKMIIRSGERLSVELERPVGLEELQLILKAMSEL